LEEPLFDGENFEPECLLRLLQKRIVILVQINKLLKFFIHHYQLVIIFIFSLFLIYSLNDFRITHKSAILLHYANDQAHNCIDVVF